MRVLVVAPQPFFSPRGTPISVYFRCRAMAEQGAQIDLLTYGEGQDVEVSGLTIHRIARLGFLGPVPIGPSWRKLLLDLLMIVATLRRLVSGGYRIVHAHEEAIFWCMLFKPLFRFRLIYDMHSSLPQQLRNFRFTRSRILIGIFAWLERASLDAADAVITICPALQDYAIASGVAPERQLLIENSIFDDVRVLGAAAAPTDGPARQPEPPLPAAARIVLYAGTLEVYQGVDLLIAGFARIAAQLQDAHLLIVGGSPQQVDERRARAAALGIASRCSFTGQVSRAEARRWTAAASVLVSLRLSGDNTPLKIYEQLASGKPLVATRIAAHTQVLSDTECFLVDVDPDAVAAGLARALDDAPEAARRAAAARERFDREYGAGGYERKIRRLLALVA